jgi:hypothetical protein
LTRTFFLLALALIAAPSLAQVPVAPSAPIEPAPANPPIVFKSGTGDSIAAPTPLQVGPAYKRISCAAFEQGRAKLTASYPAGIASSSRRLDRALLDDALASYEQHVCKWGSGAGPSIIIVVDYAKRSSEPRLYAVDLESGQGLDSPVAVAHGIGSDPDDDGYVDAFSNVQESWMSSLGAARGGELYSGRNGLSLRLDGLDASNSAMRERDIVVHSYAPERRRYFNYSLLSARGGRPGASEGCLVVEPHRRDWLFDRLRDGGFLFVGLGMGDDGGARRARLSPRPSAPPATPGAVITFAPGTGG